MASRQRRPITELKRQCADFITKRLKESPQDKRKGRLSVIQMASDLEISRQAVYDIKAGRSYPSISLVQKGCEVWDEKFKYGWITLDKTTAGPKRQEPPPTAETQADLFEVLVGQLGSRNFEVVAAKPMGRAMEITLRLTLPAVEKAAG
jgi:DNA-binding XRE family transcriptional regulator